MTSKHAKCPDSPRQRYPNQQKKPKPDHISMIHQNLKLMKNQTDQFLKKGNKELPPITRPRHYLYLNFLKQNLTLSEILNDDRTPPIKDPSNPNMVKHNSLIKPYSGRNSLNQRYASTGEKNHEESESIIVIKQNNKEFIKIVREQPIPEVNELTGKSVQFSLTKTARRPFSNIKTVNANEFKCNLENHHQSPNQIQTIDKNMARLRQTHQISGQIINSFHSDNLPLRYSKINPLNQISHQIIMKESALTFSKNTQIKQDMSEFFLKQKQINEERRSTKYLFGQKLIIKEKPTTLSHYTLEAKNDKKRKQQVQNKVQHSILDHIFAPTKNILNQKFQQIKTQTQTQIPQPLSSDSIDLQKQRQHLNRQIMQNSGNLLFNPLRSAILSKETSINDTLLCYGFRNLMDIPRAIEALPSRYKKKWIEEIEISMQKLSHLQNSSLDRTSDSVVNEQSRTNSIWKRHPIVQNRISENKMMSKKIIQQSPNLQVQGWQPWPSKNQIPQNMQNYNFQEVFQVQ